LGEIRYLALAVSGAALHVNLVGFEHSFDYCSFNPNACTRAFPIASGADIFGFPIMDLFISNYKFLSALPAKDTIESFEEFYFMTAIRTLGCEGFWHDPPFRMGVTPVSL
jgi:hypothetical protein